MDQNMQVALNLNLTAHEGPEAMEEASVMMVGLNPPLLRDGIVLLLLSESLRVTQFP